jgi:hypothetical protein
LALGMLIGCAPQQPEPAQHPQEAPHGVPSGNPETAPHLN